MSRVWFTADPHFGHRNIIKYCKRPFLSEAEKELAEADPRGSWQVSDESVKRHDDTLIDRFNSLIDERDTLWVLGDFCWGDAQEYVDRLHCKTINLVWGNHDKRSIAPAFNKTMEQGMVKVEGQKIWLNHYPMRSWDGRFHGAWHLYGHVHNRFAADDEARLTLLTKDAGVDACDYHPISFEDLAVYMEPRVQAFNAAKELLMSGESDGALMLD